MAETLAETMPALVEPIETVVEQVVGQAAA